MDILDNEKKIPDVGDIVRKIRTQRLHAVQTESEFSADGFSPTAPVLSGQFWYIHHALLDKCIRDGILEKREVNMKSVMEAYRRI